MHDYFSFDRFSLMLDYVIINIISSIEGVEFMDTYAEIKTNIPHEVDPIKKQKDIEKIKTYLRGKKDLRDYCLFVLGINIGLRAGDLLNLKIGDVYNFANGTINNPVVVKEQKTKKTRVFQINPSAQEGILTYLNTLRDKEPGQYLFKSRKGNNEPLTVSAVHKLIKTTLRELNVKGNYGSHTLRKTFSFWIYTSRIADNPGIVQTLQKILNHSSESQTLKYIGITREVIKDVYMELNL